MFRYNSKSRLGKGFTLMELKAAGINTHLAPTIGIAVDLRRKNRSQESLDRNVARLKEYMSRLILFPRKKGIALKGDASPEEVAEAKQLVGELIPFKKREDQAKDSSEIERAEVTKEMQDYSARQDYRMQVAYAYKQAVNKCHKRGDEDE